ncbi:hypothetical protein GF323_05175 [Candidatus Woesearchaeota archaeon]|nr:hypothetical protein [Candidatus Woesearchaeota archaeon]
MLVGIDKKTAREYVNDMLRDDIFETGFYKQGEAGILLFPSKQIQQDVPAALEAIADTEPNKVFYYQIQKDRLVA